MCLFELWFSLGICPVVGLLGHMVILFLVFCFVLFFYKFILGFFLVFFFFKGNAIYLFIYGCVGSSFLCEGFL